MNTETQRAFIDGEWTEASSRATYQSIDPSTGNAFGPAFPVSDWADVEAALAAAYRTGAFATGDVRASLLERYADLIDQHTATLSALAAKETGLPAEGRFAKTEIPRTTNQLRQAAATARSGDWSMPTIDAKLNIRSCLGPIGPVAVFGPVNFPFAYNAIAGGDFASAIAAGNPVIGRAHPSHPQTTLELMKLLVQAAGDIGIESPAQLLFGFSNDDGLRLARDKRLAAIGFTGSRHGGLALKGACDSAGIPFYGELSSINPVVITPAALAERFDTIVEQYVSSVLLAGGQMCTNPGLVFLIESEESTRFINAVIERFNAATPAVLLNEGIVKGLQTNVARIESAGAKRLCGGTRVAGDGFRFANTLLTTTMDAFIKSPAAFQTEMFGPAALFVVGTSSSLLQILGKLLEGNLCGSLYLAASESTAPEIETYARLLRARVGRLLTDKMPTGVAVTSAMNHGGPFPSTGHAGFTAVGFPTAARRFARLDCYDNVRPELLPAVLRDENPTDAWRMIDGNWTKDAVAR